MKKVNKAAVAGGVAAVALSVAVSMAPPALAMTQEEAWFVEAVEKGFGIYHADGNEGLLDLGYAICRDLKSNYSASSIVSTLVSVGTDISYQDAKHEVVFATTYLCPSQIVKTLDL